jgi:hypothetical protein
VNLFNPTVVICYLGWYTGEGLNWTLTLEFTVFVCLIKKRRTLDKKKTKMEEQNAFLHLLSSCLSSSTHRRRRSKPLSHRAAAVMIENICTCYYKHKNTVCTLLVLDLDRMLHSDGVWIWLHHVLRKTVLKFVKILILGFVF